MNRHSLIFSAILVAPLFSGCNKDSLIEEPDDVYRQFCVIEYTPAPGQFINENMDCKTPAEACKWAQARLDAEKHVSLGAFGGYIIIRSRHSITEFAIKGNSFVQPSGGSNEPGIVYVMTDRNRNGKPDDGPWVELRGSDSDNPATIRNYEITYFRPDESKQPVRWTDNLGNSGQVNYVEAFHAQDSYYPAWITTASYTLSGTCLPPHSNEENGRWNHLPYGWGYADNTGSDTTDNWTVFSLQNAIGSSPAKIDFIKVQTAVNAQAGALGEISTEVCGFMKLE
ncbi:MAG: hypothetical protein K2O38_00405 [Muribaculaceae bacterium]|nr:hypothetical protein [Muribaculaceae bacterium]